MIIYLAHCIYIEFTVKQRIKNDDGIMIYAPANETIALDMDRCRGVVTFIMHKANASTSLDNNSFALIEHCIPAHWKTNPL